MVDPLIFFQKIILAIAIGALIGIEREKRGKGQLVEGLRTFTLVSLLGAISGFLSETLNNQFVVLIVFASIGILTILGYMTKVSKQKHYGLTTEIAFLLTFSIGVIIYFGSYLIGVTLGIFLTLILFLKESSHIFVKHLTKQEIFDAIIFAIIAVIILPQLPDKFIGPLNIFNPFLIWTSIVLVLTISFSSYIAMKVFGVKNGLAFTGLFGGLASSTAVTVSMAEKVKANPKILYSAIFAISIASSTMFFRTIFVSYFFNQTVALKLLVPLGILGIVGYVLSFLAWRKSEKEKPVFKFSSPLALKSALKFAVFFVIIFTISALAKRYFGETGIYFISGIGGLLDADAVAISLSTLASVNSINTITLGIILATLANTFSKWFLVNWLSTKQMSKEIAKIFGILILIGIILLAIFRFSNISLF